MKIKNYLVAFYSLLFLAFLGISSCSEDEPVPITLSADAGASQTVDVGTTVNLDGTASTSSDGSTFDYSWAITDAPAGSNATITNSNTATPSFTPDVEGNYIVALTISSGNVQDTDDVLIVAEPGAVALTASAGSDQTVELGDQVALDGTGSTSSDGSAFDYSWALTDAPTNSTATINNETTATPTFTPDVGGNYTITLTISNSDGQDSDEVIITVEEPSEPIEIGGTIDTERTLVNRISDPILPDYIASSTVNVRAQLNIEPGVVVHFKEDIVLDIEATTGSLNAVGTAEEPIELTSANAISGVLWKGIYIGSTSTLNKLDFVTVSFAGNSTHNFSGDDFAAAIGVESTGKISVTNSTIINNAGYGLYIDDNGGQLENFGGNSFDSNGIAVGLPANEVDALDGNSTFANNTTAQVEIFATTYAETKATTWPDLNSAAAYRVSGPVNINGDLTIAPGAIFEFDENVVMNVAGSLQALGTAAAPITFTTSSDAGLKWKGIYVNSASSLNSLDFVNVSHAGNSTHNFAGDDFAAAIGVESTGKISVTNSTISNNTGYGLYMDNNGGQLETFNNNVFENNDVAVGLPADEVDALDSNTTFTNNANAEVEIFATTYSETKTSTWPDLNGSAAYRVTGTVDINGELSIAPGAIFVFDENVLMRVYGSIQANGTSTDHITFTTSNLNGNLFWRGIYINSASTLNKFNYVDLSYAGNSTMDFAGSDFAAGIGVESSGNVSVTNSSITNNKDYGLYVDNDGGKIGTFSNNHFEGNLKGVGVPANEVAAIDNNTTFTNNSFAAVEIFGTNLASTEEVTWNALSNNAAYRLTGNMDVNGVLTVAPGTIIEADQDVQIRVNGALIADGTANEPITFTTSNLAGGILWKGLFFLSADARNLIDNATVSYAGNTPFNFSGEDFSANVGINTDAVLTITNSVITNSGGYGIYNKGTLTHSGNTFTSNPNGNFL